MLTLTAEQMQFISHILMTVISSLMVGFLTLVWKFVKAVNEVPRMKKGMRILFERLDESEKQINKLKDDLKIKI